MNPVFEPPCPPWGIELGEGCCAISQEINSASEDCRPLAWT